MDQHYSDLELVRYDETARAPERDHGVTTLEFDASALAPQTVPDITPQVFYSTEAPEAYENNSTKENTASLRVTKSTLKWPLIVAAVFATAIAIGVGVGVWRHRHLSHERPSVPRPLVPQAPQNTSNPNTTPSEEYILNDTSLAALLHANGDRQLFFQDNTGLIRNAICTSTGTQWSMGPNISVSSNVKEYTPLAVNLLSDDTSPSVLLYYVSESHTMHSSYLLEGTWFAVDPKQNFTTMANYTTEANTRSLWVGSVGTATENLISPALLFYENSTGGISALLRSPSKPFTVVGLDFQYVDVTHQLYESNPDLPSSAAFACPANWTNTELGPKFFIAPNSLESLLYTFNPSGPGNFSSLMDANDGDESGYSSINRSDVALYGSYYAMWINGTQPATFPYTVGSVLPNNSFPFTRLASAISVDQSTSFVYHQINGTTFAEEQWDTSLGAWAPTAYITVSGS